jgi:hypothetical protein
MSETIEDLLLRLPTVEGEISEDSDVKEIARYLLEYYLNSEGISEEELREGDTATGMDAYSEACGEYDGAIGNAVSLEDNPFVGSHRDL